MANILFKVDDLKQAIKKAEEKNCNTIIFTSTGTIKGNSNNIPSLTGEYLGELPFILKDEPNEKAAWPEYKHKMVISRSYSPPLIRTKK